MADKKKAGLFDHLNQVKKGKDPEWWNKLTDKGKKSWSTFMINRFMSMCKDYLPIINELQPYVQHMEDEHVYRLYAELFPYDPKFYKYVKGKKGSDFPDYVIDLLSDHFHVSKEQAEDYIKIYLSTEQRKQDLLDLMRAYAMDEKKIQKVQRMKVKQRD
jgi:hypothetical protein